MLGIGLQKYCHILSQQFTNLTHEQLFANEQYLNLSSNKHDTKIDKKQLKLALKIVTGSISF